MTHKNLLFIIRSMCIGQFCFVFLFVLQGGAEKSEMIYVLMSAVFGLACDGFSQTFLKTAFLNQQKQTLDTEFDHLLKNFKKDIKDQ